ncbi:MAG: hypothetical protein AMS22_01000 [Thiotrichales bacterium SG8_50]|nr:MAG: hypothetical protein AMS22_01000 [Thiotrichales bacterium SG8_50]
MREAGANRDVLGSGASGQGACTACAPSRDGGRKPASCGVVVAQSSIYAPDRADPSRSRVDAEAGFDGAIHVFGVVRAARRSVGRARREPEESPKESSRATLVPELQRQHGQARHLRQRDHIGSRPAIMRLRTHPRI